MGPPPPVTIPMAVDSSLADRPQPPHTQSGDGGGSSRWFCPVFGCPDDCPRTVPFRGVWKAMQPHRKD
eukprot:12918603-Prorocentrum_lima.AAC.1